MNNERNLKIISHKKGFFDYAPQCNIMLDGVYIGKLPTGDTFCLKLDNKPHTVRCEYRYGKNGEKIESSNSIYLEHELDYILILKGVADTHMKQFKESLSGMLTKGYVGVREIKLIEDEHQAAINKDILLKKQQQNKRQENTNTLWDEMSKY